jgi:drug/metabolite transporter (DMT)-like permease
LVLASFSFWAHAIIYDKKIQRIGAINFLVFFGTLSVLVILFGSFIQNEIRYDTLTALIIAILSLIIAMLTTKSIESKLNYIFYKKIITK